MLAFAPAMMLHAAAALVLQAAPADSSQQSVRREPGLLALVSAPLAQDLWTPGTPHVRIAPARSRYNRVEGLSLAAVGGWETGANSMLVAIARLGVADLVPNAEVELAREVGFRKKSVAVYHRLSASNEWGNPLALGASLGALFIGRDEGFYYRTGGVEVRIVDSVRHNIETRFFAERHRSARVKNDFSIADIFGDRDFHRNIVAHDGDIAGAGATVTMRRGDLATDLRLFGELKLEAAAGDFDYTRGMVEAIVSSPISQFMLWSVTASAGASGGTLPLQRNWFLGGSRSARGQRPGVMVGDAFWMTQLELGTVNVFARPVLFFDAAWAGSRDDFTSPGRVATGAGIGGSFFDGSLRFDLARGLYPGRAWRGALYFEARM